MLVPLQRVSTDGTSTMPVGTPPLDRIATLSFTRRKESWVAESAGCFYKIPRNSDDPLHDLDDPACIETAVREHDDMRFLGSLAANGICPPEHIERACIVYLRLSGPDLRTLLLRSCSPGQCELPLRSAMLLLARLHLGAAADYKQRGCSYCVSASPTAMPRQPPIARQIKI